MQSAKKEDDSTSKPPAKLDVEKEVAQSHPSSWEKKESMRMKDCDFSAKHHPGSVQLVQRDAEEAIQRKTKGNELFAKGKFLEAFDEYTEALEYAPLDIAFEKNRAVFYSNRAACCIELGRNEEAILDCNRALELDSRYLKAILRRARAHENLDQLDECLADMDAALAIDPKTPNLRSDREKMDKRVKEKHEKLKEEMMGKLKEMGNMVLGKFGLSLDNFKMEQDPSTGSYSVNFKQ